MSKIQRVCVMFLVLVLMLSIFKLVRAETRIETGLMVREGNTDTVMSKSKVEHKLKEDCRRFKVGIDYLYDSDDGEKSNENVLVYGEYEQEFADRFYWMLNADYEYDYSDNLERRIVISPGVGVYFIKELRGFMSGDVGLSYRIEKYDYSDLDDGVDLRLRERVEWDLNEFVSIEQKAEIYTDLNEIDLHDTSSMCVRTVLEGTVRAKVMDNFSISTTVRDEYISHAPGDNNDLSVIVGASYEF